jgi:hypothetical protein
MGSQHSQTFMGNPEFDPNFSLPSDPQEISDDELLDEVLNELAHQLFEAKLSPAELRSAPIGFQVAYWIVDWESASAADGWGAASNRGAEFVADVARVYEQIGVNTEAEALRAVVTAMSKSENENESTLRKAYRSVKNPFSDEAKRERYVLNFVRKADRPFG